MIGRLWTHHRYLFLAFVAAVVLALFFAVRTAVFMAHWSDPANRDRPIEGWMTPRYVAHSWDLPREVVGEALGLDPGGAPRITLDEIATERGVPLQDLVDALTAAIEAERARP